MCQELAGISEHGFDFPTHTILHHMNTSHAPTHGHRRQSAYPSTIGLPVFPNPVDRLGACATSSHHKSRLPLGLTTKPIPSMDAGEAAL